MSSFGHYGGNGGPISSKDLWPKESKFDKNITNIDELGRYIRDWRMSKGFTTPDNLDTEASRDKMLGKLMLVVTEVAEAAEAVRHEDWDNFVEELADVMIRMLDITYTCGLKPSEIINDKMKINEGRPHLHGKKTTL